MVADHHLWSQGFSSDFILTAEATSASTSSVTASSSPESAASSSSPAASETTTASSSSPAASETAAAETSASAASSEASLALGLGVVQGHLVAVNLAALHGFFGGLAVVLVVEVHKAKARRGGRGHTVRERSLSRDTEPEMRDDIHVKATGKPSKTISKAFCITADIGNSHRCRCRFDCERDSASRTNPYTVIVWTERSSREAVGHPPHTPGAEMLRPTL